VKTEKLLAVIILKEEEYDDLLVYRMSKRAMDIFRKRKVEGYYSS
jgi:predicted Fe-Mo cluster-binding NifX family protein